MPKKIIRIRGPIWSVIRGEKKAGDNSGGDKCLRRTRTKHEVPEPV
jgi:hypothetical protein